MAHSWRSSLFLPIFFCTLLAFKPVHAQDSLDALQKQLDDLKANQKALKDSNFSAFMTDMNGAAVDGEAAIKLLDKAKAGLAAEKAQANGDSGSTDENSDDNKKQNHRQKNHQPQQQNDNQDAASDDGYPLLAAAHWGLVRFAALYILHPDYQNLDASWKSWLESVGENYPKIKQGEIKHGDLSGTSVSDSIVVKYYHMDLSGKDQSDWKVSKLPELYQKYILKPLGDANDPRVLASWDTYGAMEQADVDKVTFDNDVQPSLYFQKGVADYKLAPSVEKLNKLYAAAKATPTHKDFSKWLDTIAGLIADFRTRSTGGGTVSAPATAPAPAPANAPSPTPVSL